MKIVTPFCLAFFILLMAFIFLPTPTQAAIVVSEDNVKVWQIQPPQQITTEIEDALSPLVDFLQEYADIATTVLSDTESTTDTLWIKMLYETTEGITITETISDDVPVDYYPDAPQTIRQYGYTYEALTSSDMSAMNTLDFVAWLGWAVALPFLYLRSVAEIGETIGPIGLFISWLLMAVFWVAFVYFMEFLLSMASALLGLIGRVVQFIGLAK